MESYPAILQVSLQSRRLPGKALLPLGGRASWEWALRACLRSPAVSCVVAQTTEEDAEQPLVEAIRAVQKRQGLQDKVVWLLRCGAKEDALRFSFILASLRAQRWWPPHQQVQPAAFFRVTADCPLLDWRHFGRLAEAYKPWWYQVAYTHADAASWSNYPDGSDIELLNWRVVAERQQPLTALYKDDDMVQALEAEEEAPPGLAYSLDTWADYFYLGHLLPEVLDEEDDLPSYKRILGCWSAVRASYGF